ncbi:hypothetical protein F2Q69_00041086 [Brassica cretica]|uniref:Uncharacterized protein n=1 Tax=Brassica cretica TaxID=69181 RepID=A0A8S9N6R4_BRACR|nr:hypothetical protein F2Q69_00041086 [Brassica cretica]
MTAPGGGEKHRPPEQQMDRLWEHGVHTERICLALRARSAAIGDGENASAFDMSEL